MGPEPELQVALVGSVHSAFPAHCDTSTKPVLLVRLGSTACVLRRQESWAYISKDPRQWRLEVKDASVTQSAG